MNPIHQSATFIIGISGGTASGKTTFVANFAERLGSELPTTVVPMDSYYKCRAHFPPEERALLNYDHPDAIDFDLLKEHVGHLASGKTISMPIYDFSTHSRQSTTIPTPSSPVLIVEGILAFHSAALRDMLDHRVFFDLPEDLRFQRRLARDVRERGRTEHAVRVQWEETVLPMHRAFCEPAKSMAHRIVSSDQEADQFLSELLVTVRQHYGRQHYG